MSAEGSKTPGSLFKSFQAALSTPRRLLSRVAGGTSSPAAAAASGDAASEDADKPVEQASAPMHSGSTPHQRSRVLQEPKAEAQLPGSLQQTLLQQTAGWDYGKHAALERFFGRANDFASNSHNQQQADRRGQPIAVLEILKNRPASQIIEEGPGPVRRSGVAARYTPYGRPAAGPSRTGAGQINSANALYSNAGKHRPLTPMPSSKPGGGGGPLSTFLLQAGAAQAVAGGSDTQQQQDVTAAGSTRQTPAPGDGLYPAAGAPTSSLFGIAANNNSNAAPLFPATANIRQSAAAFTERPPSRSGGFGASGGVLGGISNKDLPGLLGAGIPSAPKPVLGLPRARANKAPLMGAKRGSAGRQRPGLLNAVVAGAPGALKPMRNTPLKLGLPAPGSKRGSDMHGPSVLDTVVVGHKRIRMATTSGLRAMSGLGTSPGSTGSQEGGSSSRAGLQATAAAAEGPDNATRQQEMPVVKATSVAETIMDTMRSLEKGGAALNRNNHRQHETPAASAPPPLDRLDGGALRTQLFATPNFKQQKQQPQTPGDATPSGVTVGAPGTTPWARKTDAGAAPPSAPGSVAANKTPGSFFTPVSAAAAAADVPKMPHISPITPWTAGQSGDGAFGALSSANAQSSQQQQQRTTAAVPNQKENGRIEFSFGISSNDTELYQTVAKITGSVSSAALEKVQVPSFTFTSPSPVQSSAAAVAAAADKHAVRAEAQQHHEQQLEQQGGSAGNPLLAPIWTAKFQQQQFATPAPVSGPGGFLQSGAATNKAFGTPAVSNSALPKWGTTPAAGGAGTGSKTAAASPSSPVFAIDAVPADGDVDGMVLPPGCDPALLADEVKKAAEVPLPVDSEEENDVQQQQQYEGNASGDKQQPPADEDEPSKHQVVVSVAAASMTARAAAGNTAGVGTQQAKPRSAKPARKVNRFSVLDVMDGSDEGEEAAPEPQANGDVQKQQQQQQRETRRHEQLHQQDDDDTTDRKRKKRVSFTPALAPVSESAANGSPAATKPVFAPFKQQQEQTAVPFGSPFGAPAPAAGSSGVSNSDSAKTESFENGLVNKAPAEAPVASGFKVPGFGANTAGVGAGFSASSSGAGFGGFGSGTAAGTVKSFTFGVDPSPSGPSNAAPAAGASSGSAFGASEPAAQQAPATAATAATAATPSIFGVSASSAANTSVSASSAAATRPAFTLIMPAAAPTTTLAAPDVSAGAGAAAPQAAAAPAGPGSAAQSTSATTAGSGLGATGSSSGLATSQSAGTTAAQSSTTGAPAMFSFGVPPPAAAAPPPAGGAEDAAKPAAVAPGFGGFGASSSTANPAAAAAAGSTPSFGATSITFGALPAASAASSAAGAAAAAATSSTPATSGSISFGVSPAAAASTSTPTFGASSSSAAAPAAAAANPFGFGTTRAGGFSIGSSSAAASAAAAVPAFTFGAPASSAAAAAASSAPAVAFGANAGSGSSSGPSISFSFGAGSAAAPASAAAATPAFTFGATPASNAAAATTSSGSGGFGGFGAPAAAAAPGAFGAPAAAGSGGISPAGSLQAPFNAPPAAANPFGAPGSNSTGGFGATQAGFAFGGPAPPAAAAPFGAAPFGSTQPGAGVPFGQQPQQQPAAPFAFGAAPQQQPPAAPFGAAAPAAGFAFGAQPTQQPQQPPFGAAPAFGAPQQQQQQAPAFGAFGAGAAAGGDAGAMFTMGNVPASSQQQHGSRRIVKARRKGGR